MPWSAKNPVGAGLPAMASVGSIQIQQVHFNAASNGIRAICVAFNEPKYNHDPYSRTVVIGE
jgi:hypothetical protein